MASEHVERKLAAIVAADVAGYSRLMAADEEGTLARLKAHRKALIDPKIAEHSGRIIKTTGDGMLVEFASVVDAVRCVVEIQRGMLERNADIPENKRIDFRVGINIGDVIVDGDDIYGDGVNVAARLESLAEPGGILVSGVVRDQVRDKLSFSFDDLGERNVKNIPRPVRAYRVKLSDDEQPPPAAQGSGKLGLAGRPIAWIAAAILLVIAAAGGWYGLGGHLAKPTQAAHLSIVVLPFANLSGDPSQDYFADGVTDNLTTDLARIPSSFVIASNTAFTYKGMKVDAKEIGKELGVRYVLEGSVQREQNRVRVNAQLVDATSGAHLWAERFEEDVADLFRLQDRVVARLDNSLGNELVKAEAEKASQSKNPDAIDLIMRGRKIQLEWWSQPSQQTKTNNDSARDLFEQALKDDPNNADALAGIAETYAIEWGWHWTKNSAIDYEAKIIRQADLALALDPGNATAYLAKTYFLQNTGRPNEALRVSDIGLAINPNSALLHAMKVNALNLLGRFAEAKAEALEAMKLSPRDPQMGWWHMVAGDAELGLGDFDAAVEEYQKDLDVGHHTLRYLDLASAYALAGKMDEAKAALSEAQRLYPGVSIISLLRIQAIPRWYEGLRKAGLPDQ